MFLKCFTKLISLKLILKHSLSGWVHTHLQYCNFTWTFSARKKIKSRKGRVGEVRGRW